MESKAYARCQLRFFTALRIGRALGTTPEFWINLQRTYDLDVGRVTTDVSSIELLVPMDE